MRKALGVLVLVAVLLAFGASGALAQATVIKDFMCKILAKDSGLPVDLTTSDKSIKVESDSGNVMLTCHFVFDPDEYTFDRAIISEGFLCTILDLGAPIETYDTMAVTTPGGKVHLKCRANKQMLN